MYAIDAVYEYSVSIAYIVISWVHRSCSWCASECGKQTKKTILLV